MSKFKVGDRVRRVANGYSSVPIGYETEVLDLLGSSSRFFYSDMDGDRLNTRDEYWELVTPASPVRSVPRKEIMPGVYGRVRVGASINGWVEVQYVRRDIPVDIDGAALNAAELRAAAATFTVLADALDEVA